MSSHCDQLTGSLVKHLFHTLKKMLCGMLLVTLPGTFTNHFNVQRTPESRTRTLPSRLSDSDISTYDSEEWVRSIDLGGLKHVSDMTYMLFMSMEQEVRKHLQIATTSQNPQRETIEKQIKKNNDVLFYWCIVSAEWKEDTASTLLDMIVKLWITICGFSGASGWLEKYKQMNKKTVQKSKGVRKQLVSTSTK